ncbi:hypothetical protein GGX14DRAFT_566305 [Mycena pura]|uniref:Uncharacterized protein n=1 Tax=Mycena pura TaxID=153505 RepID=A0AAD6VCJ2_9AGAR|nr:hypothetical protein GGX14DRAFT_566305 [Mycena pura]
MSRKLGFLGLRKSREGRRVLRRSWELGVVLAKKGMMTNYDMSGADVRIWLLAGLPEGMLEWLLAQTALVSEQISALVLPYTPDILGHLGTARGFTFPNTDAGRHAALDVVVAALAALTALMRLVQANRSRYGAYVSAADAADRFISSIRLVPIDILVDGFTMTGWNVYADSPTDNYAIWDQICTTVVSPDTSNAASVCPLTTPLPYAPFRAFPVGSGLRPTPLARSRPPPAPNSRENARNSPTTVTPGPRVAVAATVDAVEDAVEDAGDEAVGDVGVNNGKVKTASAKYTSGAKRTSF